MKVFVTGATGYIGFNVAQAYRRAGHAVWGLTRSEEKARLLTSNEIQPVVGSMQQPESFLPTAESCSVLIHAAADYQTDTFALEGQTVEALLGTANAGACPKTLIYTSGAWVYGDTGCRHVDETTPLAPSELVKTRPETERLVLEAKHVRGLVVRPGTVYGHQGGLTGMWFAGLERKGLSAIGDGSNRWAMVHVDDLADGYLRVGESGLTGEAFNFTDASRWTVRDLVGAVAHGSDYAGKIQFIPVAEAAKHMGPFAECLALNQHVDSRKAMRLLGWQPRHGGFVDEVHIFYASWKAAQQA